MARPHFVLVLVAACGGGGESPEPTPPDCSFSTCEPPPPLSGPIIVTITNNNAPVVGVRVIIVDEIGPLVATTDGFGRVEHLVQREATVTVINPFGATDGIDDVRTIVDAKPFDTFTLTGPVTETVTMTLAGTVDPAAASYELRSSCGNLPLAAPTGPVTLPRCNVIADVMLLSLDQSGTPIGAVTGLVDLEDGGVITLGTYAAVPEQRVEYTGVERFEEIAGTAGIATPRGPLFERAFTTTITSAIGTGRVSLPRDPSNITFIDARPVALTDDLSQHGLAEWNPPSTGDRMFVDMFQTLLPTLIGPPQFQARDLITWQEGVQAAVTLESGIPPDVVTPSLIAIELSVTRGEQRWKWSIASRYFGPAIRLPVIASEHALELDDTVTIDRLFLARVPTGYDDVRTKLLAPPRPVDLISGAVSGGRIAYQELR